LETAFNPNVAVDQWRGWSHGHFYRVVGVGEPVAVLNTNLLSLDLELQTPLKEDLFPITPAQALGQPVVFPGVLLTGGNPAFRERSGRVMLLEGVIEVFEKGPGRPTVAPGVTP
jgi:hypothetical protein